MAHPRRCRSTRRFRCFDGFVVQTTQGTRFVDADQSASIHTTYVCTALSANQAAKPPLPMVDINPAGPMAAQLGRMFGRRKQQ